MLEYYMIEYYNGTLIYRYVGVLRNLDACYDQMLHPQKRILVRYNIYMQIRHVPCFPCLHLVL